MTCLNVLRPSIVQPLKCLSVSNLMINRFKNAPCSLCGPPKEQSENFDICNVKIVRGNECTGHQIRPFLYEHYWPREPSVTSLWMNPDNDYIKFLSNKYSYLCDTLCAYELIQRTGEYKLVGVLAATKIFPWEPDELEEWAHATCSVPEQSRMYFMAHCYRSANLWKKYKVDYFYELEVLVTATEVAGKGVGTLLMKRALQEALWLRHPLILVICTSRYTAKVCEKCGLKKEWSVNYWDFIDNAGMNIFYPRRPHLTCDLYIKKFDQREATALPCLPEVW